MFLDYNRPISYFRLEIIYHNYIFWECHGRSYHCTAVGAIWNLSTFTGSTGKCLYSIFLENRSVLGANISSAYNTSTGASKYIKIVKIHYPPNFQNFPKLCITFNALLAPNRWHLLRVEFIVGMRWDGVREGGKHSPLYRATDLLYSATDFGKSE